MIKKHLILFGLAILCFASMDVKAQNDDDMFELTLEELMGIELSVASNKAMTQRESPGILTVITREEIRMSGARDLIDVLNLVPGFGFAGDVAETVGIATRGLWGNEGKVLILIDGIELNETLYGTLQFNNHISADQIDQMEIIRGPGSSMYGGSAELAVIKITTRSSNINGAWAQVTPSFNEGDINMKYDAGIGHQYDDWGYGVAMTYKNANRSNELLWNKSVSYDMSEKSDLVNPIYVNTSINYKKIEARFIQDNYAYKLQDYYEITTEDREEIFNSSLASLKYTWDVNDKLIITPTYTYKNHNSWQHKIDEVYRWNVKGIRHTFDIAANYTFTEKILLSGGVNYYNDNGIAGTQTANNPDTHFINMGGDNKVSLYNVAVYSQLELSGDYGNFTFGGRFENHEIAGNGFVPRIAYTKAWDKWHTKMLYSQAFRTPNIEVIRYNVDNSINGIEREKTTAFEFEVGRKFFDIAMWSVNAFHLKIDKPILYVSSGAYENGSTVSTYGFETDMQIVPRWGSIRIGYGFYRAGEQGAAAWASDNDRQNACMPTHKFTYQITYNVFEKFSVNANGFITSATRSFEDPDGDWVGNPTTFDGLKIVNLYGSYNIGMFDFALGISDLLNEKQAYYPAYDNWSGSIPSMSREVFLKLTFNYSK
ncbi:MAG: TonB-dependent receptor plug domain-containing protein [Reichenbachiella sp.]